MTLTRTQFFQTVTAFIAAAFGIKAKPLSPAPILRAGDTNAIYIFGMMEPVEHAAFVSNPTGPSWDKYRFINFKNGSVIAYVNRYPPPGPNDWAKERFLPGEDPFWRDPYGLTRPENRETVKAFLAEKTRQK
jgi:hypothetical protein